MEINIHIHHHQHSDGNTEEIILKSIIQLNKTVKQMSQAVEDLKAKIQAQSGALDAVSTNVTGIANDVAFLKDKLSQVPDGATAEEIAEIAALVDGVGEKVTAIGTATADLDAATDSSTPDPNA